MSNYYKLQINTTTYNLNEIVQYYNNDVVTTGYTNTNLTKSTNTFTSTINEKPYLLGYKYQNTDISEYCISLYVESSGTTYSSIPPWCKKIRAILIGGGGNGKKGQDGYAGNHDVTNNVRQNVNSHNSRGYQYNYRNNTEDGNTDEWNYDTTVPGSVPSGRTGNGTEHYDNDTERNYGSDHRHHHGTYSNTDQNVNTDTQVSHTPYQQSGSGGGGGGGGGFIYLEDTNVVSKTVSVSAGGIAGDTILTIDTTTYNAKGGVSSSSTTGGSKGTTTGTAKINSDGTNGGDASGTTAGTGGSSVISTYSSTLPSYGKGGDGSKGTAGGVAADNAASGTGGYYRIYFIAN